MTTQLRKLTAPLLALHEDEAGMEAIQVVMITGIAALVLTFIKVTVWVRVQTWVNVQINTLTGD